MVVESQKNDQGRTLYAAETRGWDAISKCVFRPRMMCISAAIVDVWTGIAILSQSPAIPKTPNSHHVKIECNIHKHCYEILYRSRWPAQKQKRLDCNCSAIFRPESIVTNKPRCFSRVTTDQECANCEETWWWAYNSVCSVNDTVGAVIHVPLNRRYSRRAEHRRFSPSLAIFNRYIPKQTFWSNL